MASAPALRMPARQLFASRPPTCPHRCVCPARMTKPSAAAWQRYLAARLPLRFGGLRLRGAVAERHAAYWASWMDTLPVIHTRAPGIAARLLALLRDPSAGHLPSLTAVQAAAYLHTQGFEAPALGEAFVDHAVPTDREDEPEDFPRGWQRRRVRLLRSPGAQGALAVSLLELPGETHVSAAGPEPALHELLVGSRARP